MKISVVIPTIGSRNLKRTLDSINNSSVKVDEVIISLPSNSNFDKNKYKNYSNLKFYFSRFKGQVAQRIDGFKLAKNELVVQLDDDIILEKKCLEFMSILIKQNNQYCVAAHFYNIETNESIYDNLNNIEHRLLNFLKNSNKISLYGDITDSGFESYTNLIKMKSPFKSGWIPGGCVMHFKKNLVLKNYFPFKGKAYSEDLFHSIELKKKNIELFYHPDAIAYLKVINQKLSYHDFKKFIFDDIRIRKKIVRDNNLNLIRMYLVYIIKYLKYIFF